ncbi:MAG TPA: amino acid permease [Steroidobacteraceae bacterium]|jgi:APA family basic amino acid/polyamine antiporter
MNSASPRPKLGLWMCVALVVGNTIGSGIFLLPSALAPYGAQSVVGWGFTTAGALLLAVVFARLSRALPQAGGPYAYVQQAFGPLAGFVVAWGYWVSIWVGNVSIATGAVSYLSYLHPWIAKVPGASAAVTLSVLWLLTFVNWYGVKAAGWVQAITTLLKVLPLIAVAALGLFVVRAPQLASFDHSSISLSGVSASATLALWALLGLESATVPAEKVANPGRTIPLATLFGTVVTALICSIACTAVLLLVPRDVLTQSNAPFVELATSYWGVFAGKALAIFAAISGFGALNGWILLQGELPLALAKQGVFPAWTARESKHGTPSFWLILGSALVTALVICNFEKSMTRLFEFMILLSTSACLVLYALCSLALLALYFRGELPPKLTGLSTAVVGLLAAAFSLWAIYGAGEEALVWCACLIAAGVPVYYVFRRKRP